MGGRHLHVPEWGGRGLKVIRDDGVVLDATFHVDAGPPPSLLFDAAGGSDKRARNRDYHVGLITLLARMSAMRLTITEIRVESSVTAKLDVDARRVHLKRHALPLTMGDAIDPHDLKSDISTSAREPGARQGTASGGSSRNLRIVFDPSDALSEGVPGRLGGGGATDERGALADVVDIAAGRAGHGQGFLVSTAARRAIEAHAMLRAREDLEADGWTVADVSLRKPCDFECTRDGDAELHVEVKGTMTAGHTVIVTPGELRHARRHHPETLMFVVYGIELSAQGGDMAALGGSILRIAGWAAAEGALEPMAFQYRTGREQEHPMELHPAVGEVSP